jgi:hypothetical protein
VTGAWTIGRRTGTLALVLTLALVSGCAAKEGPVVRPSGAVALVQNRPTPVGDLSVVASNINTDSASISVSDRTTIERAKSAKVRPGETSTIASLTFEVLDIALADKRGGDPGSDTSTVWILPR